ncbi:MAG: hypothetical protein RLZZ461_1887 [Planctomycetota bacterium]|jgi:hypothetical protein
MRFRTLRTQAWSYLDLVRWTAWDAFRPLPGSAIVMAGGSIAALALQVNGVALTILFARSLTSDSPLVLGPVELHPRETTLDLLLLAGAILVSMLLSTGARFASRLAELRIRERYADRCWSRGLDLVRGQDAAPPGPVPYHLNEVQRLVRSDALLCSRFAVLLLQSSVAGVKFLVACGALLLVNPGITAAILGIGAAFGAAIYRVNLRSIRISMAFEETTNDAREETRDLLIEAGSPFVSREPSTRDLPAKSRYLSMYGARLRTSDEGEAIGNLLLATVLTLTVLGIGLRTDGWREAATFLIALPYALLAFREVMRTTTSLNRFFPMVRRYRTFIEAFTPAEPSMNPPETFEIGFLRHTERKASPLPRIVLHRGDIAVVASPFIPDRHTTAWFAAALSESKTANAWIGHTAPATSKWPFDRERLESIGWSPEEFETLRSLLLADDRHDVLGTAFEPGDHLPRREVKLRPVIRLMMGVVLAGRSSPHGLVFLDGRDASRLSMAGMEGVRRFLGERIVLVVVPPIHANLPLPGETIALTMSANTLIRIEHLADWGPADPSEAHDVTDETLDDEDEDDSGLDGL